MTKTQIIPLGDRVIAKLRETEKVTKGGIILTDSVQERPQQATVLSVGPGEYYNGEYIKIDLIPGDEILITKHAGSPFQIDDSEVLVLESQDILGKLKN